MLASVHKREGTLVQDTAVQDSFVQDTVSEDGTVGKKAGAAVMRGTTRNGFDGTVASRGNYGHRGFYGLYPREPIHRPVEHGEAARGALLRSEEAP